MTGFLPLCPRPRWPFSTLLPRPAVACVAACLGLLAATPTSGQVAPPASPAAPAVPAAAADEPDEPEEPVIERLKLSTSDGVALAAWYYPVVPVETDDEEPEKPRKPAPPPPAVVILLHDVGGSHKTVEPLALDLQSRGIAVVAPDLRGHGASPIPGSRGEADADGKSLKKADFASMTLTDGGRVRDQASTRGDVETVRNWIKSQAEAGALDMTRMFVVGVGVGGAVAAQWTVADAAWTDLASGPQGRQVRGLVLVSPAWATRGFSISPALAADVIRRSLPVLVIGGARDTDAVKIYDQLKRQRPEDWSEKRAGQAAPTQAARLAEGALPTLFLRQFDTDLSGDRLAAAVPPKNRGGGGHPAAIIGGFVGAVTTAER